jgi:hypothetical protein
MGSVNEFVSDGEDSGDFRFMEEVVNQGCVMDIAQVVMLQLRGV